MTPSDAELGFRTWFISLGLGVADGDVIYANGNGPRPTARPYVTILGTTKGTPEGLTDRALMTNAQDELGEFIHLVDGFRSAIISVQAFGAGAAALLEQATLALMDPVAQDVATDAGVEVRSAGPVRDLTRLVAADLEERAVVEFEIGFVARRTSTPGHVDTLTVEATLDDIEVEVTVNG